MILLWIYLNLALALESLHPEITRINSLTSSEFQHLFLFERKPFILENYTEEMRSEDWELGELRQRFQGVLFRQGPGPYPSDFTSLEGENLEIFQFGTLLAQFALGDDINEGCAPVFAMKYIHTLYIHDDPQVACELLRNIRIPKFVRDGVSLVPLGGLIIGKEGTITTYHRHEAAINILLQGEKYWEIEGVRPFIQHPLDIVFIPHNHQHFVRNNIFSIAWTFQFHENHFGTTAGRLETQLLLERVQANDKQE